ncbi:MAG: hypothetical protein R3B90_01215 [Planctomycetaceae bacterium]
MTTTCADELNQLEQDVRDANSCMAIGAGLGAFGTGSALLLGATCPICVVLTPALLGVGAIKRVVAGRKVRRALEESERSPSARDVP